MTYFYFRFVKTNSRRVEILLPVSSLTFPLSSACDFASAYQISPKSDHRRPSYVLAIFKMAATASQIYFRSPVWWRIAIKSDKIYLHTEFPQLSDMLAKCCTSNIIFCDICCFSSETRLCCRRPYKMLLTVKCFHKSPSSSSTFINHRRNARHHDDKDLVMHVLRHT